MTFSRKLSTIAAWFVVLAIPAAASVTITAPGNDAQVSSPFGLTAFASNCSSQTVYTMGFSLDASTDTTIVKNSSIDAQVSAAVGAHTVHVKAWGNHGAVCVTDVAITVQDVVAPMSTTTSTNSVYVSSPVRGSSVASPFTLSASASTCASQAVSAMGYSLDSSSNTAIVHNKSVWASISAAPGGHTLHVKAWGDQGAACDTDVGITVTASSSSTPPQIVVSSPASGTVVPSTFTLAAEAPACSSQAVASMGYSLDSSTNTTIVHSSSLLTAVSAPTGSHTVHVKAWGVQGAACATGVAVSVGTSSPSGSGSGPIIPSYATSVSNLQTLQNWLEAHDAGTPGAATGTMKIVGSPSLSGSARSFVTTYTNYGGERYRVSFGDDATATNFVYDARVYIANPASTIANLEMDFNQVMSNGQTVIYGFQCDGWSNTWDYTANMGTPQSPKDVWIHSRAACNPRNWSTNAWHRIQVSYSRDDTGRVTYQSVWFDGVESALNVTVPSAFALGWGPTLLTNFQVDGSLSTSGTATAYLDKVTLYRW